MLLYGIRNIYTLGAVELVCIVDEIPIEFYVVFDGQCAFVAVYDGLKEAP